MSLAEVKPFTQQIHHNNEFYLQKVSSLQPWVNITQKIVGTQIQPQQFTFNFTFYQGYYSTKGKVQLEFTLLNTNNSVPNYAGYPIYAREECVPLFTNCTFYKDGDIFGQYACLSQDQLALYQTKKQSQQFINDIALYTTQSTKKFKKIGLCPLNNTSVNINYQFPLKRFFPHLWQKGQKYFHVKHQCNISLSFYGAPEYLFGLQQNIFGSQITFVTAVDFPDSTVTVNTIDVANSVNSGLQIINQDVGGDPIPAVTAMNIRLLLKKYNNIPSDYIEHPQAYFRSYFNNGNGVGNLVLNCQKYSDFHYFSLMNFAPSTAGQAYFNVDQFTASQSIKVNRNSQSLIDSGYSDSQNQELLDQFDTISCRKGNNNVSIFTDSHNYTGEISFNINTNGVIYYGIRYYK